MSCFGKCFKNENHQNGNHSTPRGSMRQIRVHNFEGVEEIRENGSSIPEKMAKRPGQINVRFAQCKKA